MHWIKKSELKHRHHWWQKPKTKFEKTRKPARHQNRKTAVFKCKNRKTEPKIGQIRKTENPNAPVLFDLRQGTKMTKLDTLYTPYKRVTLWGLYVKFGWLMSSIAYIVELKARHIARDMAYREHELLFREKYFPVTSARLPALSSDLVYLGVKL